MISGAPVILFLGGLSNMPTDMLFCGFCSSPRIPEMASEFSYAGEVVLDGSSVHSMYWSRQRDCMRANGLKGGHGNGVPSGQAIRQIEKSERTELINI